MRIKMFAATIATGLTLASLGVQAQTTKLNGTMFVDFTHIDQASHGSKTDASGTGLDVKRFYVSICS